MRQSECPRLRAYLLDTGATGERTTGGLSAGGRDGRAGSVEDPGGEGLVLLLLAVGLNELLKVLGDLPVFPSHCWFSHCVGWLEDAVQNAVDRERWSRWEV